MEKKINHYWLQSLKLFAYALIGISMLSIINFVEQQNYNSAGSSFFGIAIGYILLLSISNKENQIKIITTFTNLFDQLNERVEEETKIQQYATTITDPEQIQELLQHLQPVKPSKELLQNKLLQAIENEDYEEAEKIKLQIKELNNPPKN